MGPIKNLKKAKSIVNSIINKYIDLYDIPKPLYITMEKKFMKGESSYGEAYCDNRDTMIVFNTDKYYFDEESLKSITLHELVHCKLLLEGRQSDENIHDEVFNEEARRIEEFTGVGGIAWPSNGMVNAHVYSKKNTYYYIVFGLSYRDGTYIMRVDSKDELNYWDEYMDYEDMFTWHKPGISHKIFFEMFDVVKNHEEFEADKLDDEYLPLFDI